MQHFRITLLSPCQNATESYVHANEFPFRDTVQSQPRWTINAGIIPSSSVHGSQTHTIKQSLAPAQKLIGWVTGNMSKEKGMPLIEQCCRAAPLMGTKKSLSVKSMRDLSQWHALLSWYYTLDEFNDVCFFSSNPVVSAPPLGLWVSFGHACHR